VLEQSRVLIILPLPDRFRPHLRERMRVIEAPAYVVVRRISPWLLSHLLPTLSFGKLQTYHPTFANPTNTPFFFLILPIVPGAAIEYCAAGFLGPFFPRLHPSRFGLFYSFFKSRKYSTIECTKVEGLSVPEV